MTEKTYGEELDFTLELLKRGGKLTDERSASLRKAFKREMAEIDALCTSIDLMLNPVPLKLVK